MTARSAAGLLADGTWTVSDARTRVGFTVRGLAGRPVHGSIALCWGQVELDGTGAPRRARAELDLTSVATGIARRDADLRTGRFLDAVGDPTMTWAAEAFTRAEDGSWTADGVLGLRGTTAPLAVTGTPEPAGDDGRWVRVRASAVLDRTAVGIRAPPLLVGRVVRVVRIDVDAWLSAG